MPETNDSVQFDSQPEVNESDLFEHAGTSEEELLAAHVAQLRHQIEEANYEYYVKDNPALTEIVIHNLNRAPRLPFAESSSKRLQAKFRASKS